MTDSRYDRQTRLPQIGTAGQAKIGSARVLIVGMGGLGVPAATYLAAAGVGSLVLVDDDTVDVTNLHRQPLYTERDAGRFKVDVAAERLRALNSTVEIRPLATRFRAETGPVLLAGIDVVVDGTDNFATRYLVNDACVMAGVPNVFASLSRFDGQASVFGAVSPTGDRGPCYRCVFPEPPPAGTVPSCAEGGVLGVLPALFGTIQATETLKLVLRVGDPLVGRLLLADALGMAFRTLRVARDPACPVCGDTPTITTLIQSAATCGPSMASVPEMTALDLKTLRDAGENPFVLDVREPDEYAGANIDGALIPLGDLPSRLGELEPHRDDEILVVHCRSGARSARAVEFLQQNGFSNAVNLAGGIHSWSDTVDPSLPKV